MAMVFNKPVASAAAVSTAAKGDKPKATLWLNVGYSAGEKFVSLPVGIPLDQLEFQSESSNNEDWSFFQQARNALLKDLLEQASGLQPGESGVIEGLEIELRKVGAEKAPASGKNPYLR